jgi:hypothetical protein
MAVALDAKSGWTTSHNAVTSWTDASFTVGVGSNRVLLIGLVTEATSGSPPTAPTANWDSTGTNQSMLLLHTQTDTGNAQISSFLFGLVAPTSGLKTLSVAGLTATTDSMACYIAFTGADQTGGVTTFKNATGSFVSSGLTVTESPAANSGDAVIGLFGGNDGTPTVNQTAWAPATLTTAAVDFWISNYALATGTMAMTMTQGSSTHCNGNAVAINQVSAGLTLNDQQAFLM